ncbi:MAG: hypothetical protein GY814_07515 [Gammaproteobacteria bacterium]|nr:hypothetical protein [Gammaproteobacteria bacterium]
MELFREKNTLVLVLRWLLLPLLLYIAGQYLDGPPYRVIVRSLPFVLACFYLSIAAAHYLRYKSDLPLYFYLLQAILVPGGFVFAIQYYYNGGINTDFSLAVLFFVILMGTNAILYGCSLYPIRHQPEVPLAIKNYEINLYTRDQKGQQGTVKYHDHGATEPPTAIIVDGFSEDRYIDLRPYWQKIIEHQIDEFKTEITTYETIIKYGDTQQLVDDYLIVIKTVFSR